ncbi:MAG TPA: single-stranded DNA-binding protein [Calditerricola sp.]
MLNRVILIGRLTHDPELRYTPNGVAVASFSLAVNRPFTNQQGERETDFIDIVVWRQLAETCAQYLRKGRLVAVEGRLQIRTFENQEGRRVKVAEVVADNVRFLESSAAAQASRTDDSFEAPERRPARFDDDPFAGDSQPIDISDDDLPF